MSTDALASEEAASMLERFDTTRLARVIGAATDRQLAEGLAEPKTRELLFGEVFRRMTEHVDPKRARQTDAVIHWRISDGDADDRYEVVLERGHCSARRGQTRSPQVSLQIGGVDFLRLVTGNAAGPLLFLSGRLRIEGDLMLAARMTDLFRIPQPLAA